MQKMENNYADMLDFWFYEELAILYLFYNHACAHKQQTRYKVCFIHILWTGRYIQDKMWADLTEQYKGFLVVQHVFKQFNKH